MSAEELIRVEGVIVWEKEQKLLEADWQFLRIQGMGMDRKHMLLCVVINVSLTKQTTVVCEARGRYVIMERELTFVLPRDVRDEELAEVESILSGLVILPLHVSHTSSHPQEKSKIFIYTILNGFN